MKIHLPFDLRLSSGGIFRSSIIFVVIIASLVFASVRAVAVDNEGSKPRGHEVFISKVDLGGGDVVGAKLRILKDDAESSTAPKVATDLQNNTLAEWVTVADEPHKVNLAAGKYKLEETFAPAPWKVITPFEFQVDDHGAVKLGKVGTAGKRDGKDFPEALVSGEDNNGITVVDGIDESKVAQDVKISKVDLGGKDVVGAELQVLEVGSDSVVKDVMTQESAKWTTSKDEKVHKVSLLPGSYRLKESFAPQGLRPITTFDFSVNAQGVVTVKNVAVAGRDADDREVKEAVVDHKGVVVVTDGAQEPEKPTVTLNTNAYDASGPRWDNVLDSTGGTIADVISYEGLVPGKKYRVKGELMDKETRNGTGITSQKTFIAEDTNGEVEVEFILGSGFAGKDLVVFETLMDDRGIEVATHKDIESASQTVSVASLKESSGWKIGNVGAVIGAGIIGILSVMVVRYLTLVLQMFTRA
ncbi:VaFE repeat-containing surface-anchored protein [Corynebacterium diphtheriae]|uniref:VaFE repeat-containing surface-anchored protein n=1 Tax=Corynebacterium diphtheriae TaxID=1717 RepID=UPI00217F045A|nr:VaFE repeat-containing surface-anchored protein [Corynebacterium diphtheriae]